MRTFRNTGREMTGVLTVLIAIACAAGMAWSEQATQKVSGAHIQMGEGHFNRDGLPFHYWDKEKEIPAVCSRCHGANGVPEYLREGKNSPAPQVKNGFACTDCHADMLTYARQTVTSVTFPSGIKVDSGNNDSNLCMTCHQGINNPDMSRERVAALREDIPEALTKKLEQVKKVLGERREALAGLPPDRRTPGRRTGKWIAALATVSATGLIAITTLAYLLPHTALAAVMTASAR